MPLITRLFIKSGMIFFLIALFFGVIAQTELFTISSIVPLFWHTLMVGWISQIIIGVSMWMFPGRTKEESFVHQKWGWLTFLFLNAGLALRIISEPFVVPHEGRPIEVILIVSALFQFLAALTFVTEIWPRVISKKERLRKRRSGGQ